MTVDLLLLVIPGSSACTRTGPPSFRVPNTVQRLVDPAPIQVRAVGDCAGRENPGHSSLRAAVRTAESIFDRTEGLKERKKGGGLSVYI